MSCGSCNQMLKKKKKLKEIIDLMGFKCFCTLQKNKTTSFDSEGLVQIKREQWKVYSVSWRMADDTAGFQVSV